MLDIETTGLDASYGRLVCACFKFTDETKVRTVTCRVLSDEKKALREIARHYHDADIIVTWNGKLFDIPMLNARMMFYGLDPLPNIKHIDLLYQSKKLRFRGNRLENVSKDFRTRSKKYDVPAWRWLQAAEGQEHALDLIVRHCQFDVLLTEEMLRRLKPLITQITR